MRQIICNGIRSRREIGEIICSLRTNEIFKIIGSMFDSRRGSKRNDGRRRRRRRGNER
jgi:hypothetical protein